MTTLNDIVRSLLKDREVSWKRANRNKKQNLPRGDTATAIKKMFVPRYEGYCFMQFDLSQAELRGLGSFSHDPNLKHAYDEGIDLHKYTAANIYRVPIENVTKAQRQLSKTINFSITYQSSPATVAANAGISIEEAEDVVKKWHEFYSCVQPYMDRQGELVETQGFVTGLWGLKRNLPMYMAIEKDGADLKRQAGNASIQNFASDFNCFLMLIVMDYVKQYNLRNEIRMVNTVHDSIVFEVKDGYESTLASFYLSAMNQMNEYCAELIGKEYYVKMRGDCEVGLTYGDLYEAEIDPKTFEVSIIDKS